MEHYWIVLLLVMGILAFLQFKLKNHPVRNKYQLHLLCILLVLLFFFSWMKIQIHPAITAQFHVYIVMILLIYTMKYLNQKIEECSIMSETVYFYLGMLLWTVFFLCVVLELRDMALPVSH